MAATRGRDIVVIAASAGGVEALRGLLSQVPVTVPAALLVVLHVPAVGGKVLPGILGRAGQLPASAAADGEAPLPGHVYVAPSDCHLLLVGDKIRLSHGPRRNGLRPAADPLFISAALSCGPHTIAVVLSGTLDDGAAGAAAVERRGGVVVIQDPGESAYDGMPRAAMAATRRAKVLRLSELAVFIDRESRRPVREQAIQPDPGLDRQLRVFLDPVSRLPPGPARGAG
jgi:two-component system, chemotaxis family, protein-glutamate methylesterase/glutaminase